MCTTTAICGHGFASNGTRFCRTRPTRLEAFHSPTLYCTPAGGIWQVGMVIISLDLLLLLFLITTHKSGLPGAQHADARSWARHACLPVPGDILGKLEGRAPRGGSSGRNGWWCTTARPVRGDGRMTTGPGPRQVDHWPVGTAVVTPRRMGRGGAAVKCGSGAAGVRWGARDVEAPPWPSDPDWTNPDGDASPGLLGF